MNGIVKVLTGILGVLAVIACLATVGIVGYSLIDGEKRGIGGSGRFSRCKSGGGYGGISCSYAGTGGDGFSRGKRNACAYVEQTS